MQVKHYLVYQITNLISNKIYIGIHSTEDVDDGYMGSGHHLKRAIKKYGIENFEKTILFDFDNPEDMIQKEIELVDRRFISQPHAYNIALGGIVPNTLDSISVRDSDGNCFRVHKDDPRWLSGELVGISKGRIAVKDDIGNIFYVSVDDPRYISGILVPILTGLFIGVATVRDKNNIYFRVDVNDPRILSGELVGTFHGRHHTEDAKKKIGLITSKAQKGSGNSQYGTCWIHNLELKDTKKIKKDDIRQWLADGWVLGRK